MNRFQHGKINIAMFEMARVPAECTDAAHPPDLMGRLAGLYPSAVIEAGGNCADEPFGAEVTTADMGLIYGILHLLGFASSCGKNPTSSANTSHPCDSNNDLMWAPGEKTTDFWDRATCNSTPETTTIFSMVFRIALIWRTEHFSTPFLRTLKLLQTGQPSGNC